jgi:hypothetical protein
MTIRSRIRLAHDPSTDLITITVTSRRKRNRPLSTLRRTELRTLCDVLHDYADALDRKDRTA